MPSTNNEIIVDKVINTSNLPTKDLPDFNAGGSEGDAIRSAFKPGYKVYNIADYQIYNVVEDNNGLHWEKEGDAISLGDYIRVKSFGNTLYEITNQGISELPSQDLLKSTEKKDSETLQVLKVVSPRSWEIVKQNNILSSYELILPLILDNPDYFNKMLKSNLGSARQLVFNWLEKNGFIILDRDGNPISTDKFIEREDYQNFAAFICNMTYNIKTLNQGHVDFDFLNNDFFKGDILVNLNSDYDIKKSKTTSIHNLISNLRNSGYLYSSDKDVAIRNIVNMSFRNKDGKSKHYLDENKNLSLQSDKYLKDITKYYKQIIDFDNLKNLLSNLKGFDTGTLNKPDINAIEIYNQLKFIVDNFKILDGDLKNKLDYIVSKCNPNALVFFLCNVQSDIRKEMNSSLKTPYNDTLIFEDNNIKAIKNVLLLNIKPFLQNLNSLIKKFDVKLNMNVFEYLENPEYRYDNNSKGSKYEVPKNISPIDPTNTLNLMDSSFIDESTIFNKLSQLSDSELKSAYAGLDERTENELIKFYSAVLFINFLNTEYNIPIKPESLDPKTIVQLPDLKTNPYAKAQIVTGFPIFKSLKLIFNKLYDILKPEIKNLKDALETIMRGKTYKDNQENTDSVSRDVENLFKILTSYMKSRNNDIYALNYDDLLNLVQSDDKVDYRLATQFYSNKLVTPFGYQKVSELENYSEQAKKALQSLEIILNSFNNNYAKQRLNEINSEATRLVNTITDKLVDVLKKRSTQNVETDNTMTQETYNDYFNNPFLVGNSVFNKFTSLLRQADVRKFTIQDFNDMLLKFQGTKDNKNTTNAKEKQNTVTESLHKNSYNLYKVATTIINLFGLDSSSDEAKINEVIKDIISNSQKFMSIYSCILNINIINENGAALGALIYKILHAQKTYDYDTIKNEILKYSNGNLSIPVSNLQGIDTQDINEDFIDIDESYSTDFKQLGITSVIELNTQKNLDQILKLHSGVNLSALFVYIANKLYYSYYVLNKSDKYLIEYLKYNKFNLVLDIADSFTRSGKAISNDILRNITPKVKKLPYFFNAKLVANRLNGVKYYRDLPTNLKNAYANYKILDFIDFRLYQQLKVNPNFNLLLNDCSNIDFDDYIVGNVLSNCKIFDLNGDLIEYDSKKNNIRQMLDVARLNSTKPEVPDFLKKSFEEQISSLYNKLKGLNALGLSQNAVVMAGVLHIVKDKDIDVQNSQKENMINLEKLFNSIKEIYMDIYKLGYKSDELLSLHSSIIACINNIKTSVSDKYKEYTANVEELEKLSSDQFENVIHYLVKYISHWRGENRDVSDFVEITPLSNKDRKNPFAKGSDRVFPIHIEINNAALNKAWSMFIDNKFVGGTEINLLKNKINMLFNVSVQDFYNSISSSKCSISDAVKLKELTNNISRLKNEFNNYVIGRLVNNPSITNSAEVRTEVPSPEYVLAKVNELRNTIKYNIEHLVKNTYESEQLVDKIKDSCVFLYDESSLIVASMRIVRDIKESLQEAKNIKNSADIPAFIDSNIIPLLKKITSVGDKN